MSKASSNKFTVSFLVLAIALSLQFNFKAFFGWSPEFVMAVLIAIVFYLDVLETAILDVLSVLIMNWKPLLGLEMIVFFTIPFLVILVRKISPWESGFNNILGIILSVVLFYAVSSWPAVLDNIYLLVLITGTTAVFSAVIFHVFGYFYKISPA